MRLVLEAPSLTDSRVDEDASELTDNQRTVQRRHGAVAFTCYRTLLLQIDPPSPSTRRNSIFLS